MAFNTHSHAVYHQMNYRFELLRLVNNEPLHLVNGANKKSIVLFPYKYDSKFLILFVQ